MLEKSLQIHLVTCVPELKEAFANCFQRSAQKKLTLDSGLKCSYCDKYFSSKEGLYEHGVACESMRKFQKRKKCPFCRQSFAESLCLLHQVRCDENEMRVRSCNDQVTCPNCEKSCANMRNLRRHLGTCLAALKQLTRKSIDKFEDRDRGRNRVKAKDNDNKKAVAKCSFCKATFSSQESLLRHRVSCTEFQKTERKRKCTHCDLESAESRSYLHEVRCLSNPDRPGIVKGIIKCPKCKTATLKNNDALRLHLVHCLEHPERQVVSDEDDDIQFIQAVKTVDINNTDHEVKKEMDQEDDQNKSFSDESGVNDNDLSQDLEDANADKVDIGAVARKRSIPYEKPGPKSKKKRHIFIDNQLIPFVSSSPVKTSTTIECPFCKDKFGSLEDLKENIVRCRGIKSREPKIVCEFQGCGLKLPMTLAGLHEKICPENKHSFVPTDNNLRYCILYMNIVLALPVLIVFTFRSSEIRCPHCSLICLAKYLPTHIANCSRMDLVQKMLDQALANDSVNWEPEDGGVDYIKMAGLEKWLQQPN